MFFLQDERMLRYKVDYLGYNPETEQVELGGFDDFFSESVINRQYSLTFRLTKNSSFQYNFSIVKQNCIGNLQ